MTRSEFEKKLNSEIEEMKSGLLMFNPDPEIDAPYFTIYDKDGKVLGRSNRDYALDRFRLNVKLCEYSGAYVIFDDIPNKKYMITPKGFFETGDGGNTLILENILLDNLLDLSKESN